MSDSYGSHERGSIMLELKNISFSAESDGKNVEIIRDISLTVEDDKFIVITGPNGGGKSTLAKLIAGIEKNTAGSFIFDGEDITDKNITERAKMGIGFAFQQPVRFKGMTVVDLLRIAAGKNLSVSEACEYLSEVGLCAKDYIDREINASLSGGELKRIEIATVLARNVKLAIFDEPEAGIDLWSFNNLIRIFEKMRSECKGRSIVVISHQERILNIADEIIVIADGRIAKKGSRDEILPEITGTESAVNICHKMA
jgi:Fe-S cluster assembly ATP-binding protein